MSAFPLTKAAARFPGYRHKNRLYLRVVIVAFMSVLAIFDGSKSHASDAVVQQLSLDLKLDCKAVGDGVSDDTEAFRSCLLRLSDPNMNIRAELKVPPGIYSLSKSTQPMPILRRGLSVHGEGPDVSIFKLGDDFEGSLFSWSEAWLQDHYSQTSLDVLHDVASPTVERLRIVGSKTSKHRQAGLTFYDRNDFILLRDVEIDYLNGPCISIGATFEKPQAYARESSFYNLRCWYSGSLNEPAVEISSTTTVGSDATNELDFYKVSIFGAKNVGLAISNKNAFSSTRKIRFYGLRVEDSGGNGVEVGSSGDLGQVSEVFIYNLSVMSSKGAALQIGTKSGEVPYAINVDGGLLGPGNAVGVNIVKGRLIQIDLSEIDSKIQLGPSAGDSISIQGNGSEYKWHFEGVKGPGESPSSLGLRAPFGLFGIPSSGDRVGIAALQGHTGREGKVRLTMDGSPPNSFNCFNPGFAKSYNLDIHLLATNKSNAQDSFSWHMPLAIFSAWTGPDSARLVSGPHSAIGSVDAVVESSADRINGCLNLSFLPPKDNLNGWEVSAAIQFVRSP